MNQPTIQNEIQIGQVLSLRGTNYEVIEKLVTGANTRNACPWIKDQFGVKGQRGAVALLQQFTNGGFRLIFTTRRSVINIAPQVA